MLTINALTVVVENNSIIKSLSLSVDSGTTHIIMGPNGSGKSSLAYAVMGHPHYQVTSGSLFYKDQDITTWSTERRAHAGLFLALQNPPIIPGVKVFTLIKESYNALKREQVSLTVFTKMLYDAMDMVGLDYSYAYRSCNDGFSGGERKRLELLQAIILQPRCIIFDEIDSGLDADGLHMIARVMTHLRSVNPDMVMIFITHYQRLLNYCNPDQVHVLNQGTIVCSGTSSIATLIEKRGYDGIKQLL